jgi:Tol biopolymer transport system component
MLQRLGLSTALASVLFLVAAPSPASAAGLPGAIVAIRGAITTFVAGDGTGLHFSPDGNKLARVNWTTGHVEIVTIATKAVRRADSTASGSVGNGSADSPHWAPDSARLAFNSMATNLTDPDGAGGQVFVKDLTTGAIQLVSSSSAGLPGNNLSMVESWSPDGTSVLFTSYATNLAPGATAGTVQAYVKNLVTGTTTLVSVNASGTVANADVGVVRWSTDGKKLAFYSGASNLAAGDAGTTVDLFVRILSNGHVKRLPLNGGEGSFDWSPSGAQIAYQRRQADGSGKLRLELVYYSFATGATRCVSCTSAGTWANGDSFNVHWAPAGNRIAFESQARNFDPLDQDGGVGDVYVKNLTTGSVRNASSSSTGRSDFGHVSYFSDWSTDGDAVLFWSWDSSLVTGDTNATHDVFIKRLTSGRTQLVSADAAGGPAHGDSAEGEWRPGHAQVLFASDASNLVPGVGGNWYGYLKTVG